MVQTFKNVSLICVTVWPARTDAAWAGGQQLERHRRRIQRRPERGAVRRGACRIYRRLAQLAPGNAGLCALVRKGLSEQIHVISSVSEEPLGLWLAVDQGSSAGMIAQVTCGDDETDRRSADVCDRVQSDVHAALGTATLSGHCCAMPCRAVDFRIAALTACVVVAQP